MRPHPMTVALWCLVAFVIWTVALVVGLSVVRLRHLAAGGSVRDLGFPMIAASSGASIGAPERPGEPAPLCERRARGNSTRRDWTHA